MENDVEVATITGGFSPSRVQSFRIEGVESDEGSSRLILVNEGDIRGLIPRTRCVRALKLKASSKICTPDSRPVVSYNTKYFNINTDALHTFLISTLLGH